MKLLFLLFSLITLIGCSEKQEHFNYVVFSGGDYRIIKSVSIFSDGSWVGISYEDDCIPTTIFYKPKKSAGLIRNDRDGRDFCVENL